MQLDRQELEGGICKITLNGSLDIEGAGAVESPFNEVSETYKKVIVDMTNVDFLASIGIRVLVKSAKTIGSRGGRLAVFNPNDAARSVLASTGVDTIVFVEDDEAAAINVVS